MKSKEWRVTRSRYVHRDKWVCLRADDCVTPDGVEVAPYYVLEYSDWVHLVVLNRAGEVMVVRLYRHGNRTVNLEIPGGSMDEVDASPEAAARRELLEETGYTADTFIPVACLTPNSATHTNQVHCFLVPDAYPAGPPRQDDTEDIEHEFISLEALLDLVDRGTFRQALHVAAIHRALRHMGVLHLDV